jgi:hypothetical protein
VPGGYPEDWATEHGAPFPPVASRANAVAEAGVLEEGRSSGAPSSQSSHSACTGEQCDMLRSTDKVTTVPDGGKPAALPVLQSDNPTNSSQLNAESSQKGNGGDQEDTKPSRSSASLAVAVQVKKTRVRARRSLSGKEVIQDLPPATGRRGATAWLSARH